MLAKLTVLAELDLLGMPPFLGVKKKKKIKLALNEMTNLNLYY